ncbi:MAG: hypothetical protein OXG39_12210 [Chloroflexi bacterium]|nr:hypothetical protein [Chloroflexota bacterium]
MSRRKGVEPDSTYPGDWDGARCYQCTRPMLGPKRAGRLCNTCRGPAHLAAVVVLHVETGSNHPLHPSNLERDERGIPRRRRRPE